MRCKLSRTLILLFSSLVFGLFISSFARAGDRALLNVIGYSHDGRYFSFEEYGVQDGSGFSYSSIYIVDLNDDSWVTGTPIRMVEEYDEATYEVEPIDYGKNMQKVRKIVFEKAQARLEGLNINTPAQVLAFIGDGEVNDADGLSLEFNLPGYSGGIRSEDITISLEIYKTNSAFDCEFIEPPVGFLVKLKSELLTKEVYRDEVLPRSRACPITYKITGIYVPFEALDLTKAVAIISVYSFGYEGRDRRFVAIPIGE